MRDLLKDKKIAVFGAGGLIGSALVRGALVQGASVIADLQSEQMIDVLSAASDDECQALSFVEVDACEESSVKGFFDRMRIWMAWSTLFIREAKDTARSFLR